MDRYNIVICVLVMTVGVIACSWAGDNISQTEPGGADFRNLKLEIRRGSIASVFDPNDTDTYQGRRLQEIIDKVLAMEPPEPKLEKSGKPAPVEKAESEIRKSPQEPESQADVKPLQKTTENNTFEAIIQKKSGQIVNPLEAAESLFKNKDIKNAAKFYRLELDRIDKDKENTDRPWVIYQLANCLRRSNPTEAGKYYDRLVTEYPDFYCTEAARMQRNVIAWYQQNKPSVVLENYVSDPNSL